MLLVVEFRTEGSLPVTFEVPDGSVFDAPSPYALVVRSSDAGSKCIAGFNDVLLWRTSAVTVADEDDE